MFTNIAKYVNSKVPHSIKYILFGQNQSEPRINTSSLTDKNKVTDNLTDKNKVTDNLTDNLTLKSKSNDQMQSQLISTTATPGTTGQLTLKLVDCNFELDHGHVFDNPRDSPQYTATCHLHLPLCKNLICAMITLNNGLLLSGSFLGCIQIWDPETGRCIKKIDTLEKILIGTKTHFPQMLNMCQVTDDLIIIINDCVEHAMRKNDIYALNISTNEVQIVYNNPDSNSCSFSQHSLIIKIKEDNFVTIFDDNIVSWYITDDQQVEFISKKQLNDKRLNQPQIIMLSEKNMIVRDRLGYGECKNEYIVKTDLETNEEKYYSLNENERMGYSTYIVNGYLVITITDKTTKIDCHIMLDINTLNVIGTVRRKSGPKYMLKFVVHLKDNLIAMIFMCENYQIWLDNLQIKQNSQGSNNLNNLKDDSRSKIILVDTSRRGTAMVQTIDIGGEKIRSATKYKNGLITVNYLSEIKKYELF